MITIDTEKNNGLMIHFANKFSCISFLYILCCITAPRAVSVTRLIRIAYGDYKLDTIPPGMAIPVPYKPVTNQKAK